MLPFYTDGENMILTTKEQCLNHLEENYHSSNSPVAYLSILKLYNFYNKILPVSEIKRSLATSESYTQLSPERRSNFFEETMAFSPNDVIQFDLGALQKLCSQVLVNLFSVDFNQVPIRSRL